MKDFILHPYGYPGSSFNPKAHAETRLEIGSKKRNFVLKIHEGVLYFKEPARAPVFAIPDLVDDALAGDSIGLISRWQREISVGNYGAFIAKRDFFAGLPVRGNFLMLVRADGTGWMREHFDREWFDLAAWEEPQMFDLWNEKELDAHIAAALPWVKASLLQRVVEPEIRSSETLRWLGGSFEEFSSLVTAAVHLFLEPDFENGTDLDFKLKSHSAFAKGDIEAPWLKSACLNPKFAEVWQQLERQFHYVGVHWNEGGEKVEMYPRPRSERVFQDGLAQWGENWRGNWAPQRGSVTFRIPGLVKVSEAETQAEKELLENWMMGRGFALSDT
jgi:hypothetical protein